MALDIERAGQAVESAKYPRIHTFVATSDIHLEHKLRMSRAQVLEEVDRSIRQARTYVDDALQLAPDQILALWIDGELHRTAGRIDEAEAAYGRLIELYTYKNDVVLDPFLGSGSTAIAVLSTGRNFVGYEISQDYVELAQKRIEPETRKPEDQ